MVKAWFTLDAESQPGAVKRSASIWRPTNAVAPLDARQLYKKSLKEETVLG